MTTQERKTAIEAYISNLGQDYVKNLLVSISKGFILIAHTKNDVDYYTGYWDAYCKLAQIIGPPDINLYRLCEVPVWINSKGFLVEMLKKSL